MLVRVTVPFGRSLSHVCLPSGVHARKWMHIPTHIIWVNPQDSVARLSFLSALTVCQDRWLRRKRIDTSIRTASPPPHTSPFPPLSPAASSKKTAVPGLTSSLDVLGVTLPVLFACPCSYGLDCIRPCPVATLDPPAWTLAFVPLAPPLKFRLAMRACTSP